jgi:hypothetical protein
MQTFAQFALPGTIVASAVGAVVLCVVLLVYGFKSEPDDERAPMRRLVLIRLGHALAAACFAAALMLSTVALLDQRRNVAPGPVAQTTDEMQRLEARVNELEQRLASAEPRVSDSATVVSPVPAVAASPVVMESRRPAVVPAARSRQTATRPRAAAPAADDFGVRVRGDWESVKRGFREAGDDIRSGFTDLGRRIKRTFD